MVYVEPISQAMKGANLRSLKRNFSSICLLKIISRRQRFVVIGWFFVELITFVRTIDASDVVGVLIVSNADKNDGQGV